MKYVLACALCLTSLLSGAEPLTASSSLQIRVVIPETLHVISDEHPTAVNGNTTQTLQLRSNSRTTCVFVSARGYTGTWRASITDNTWYAMTTADGQRFCTQNRGELSLSIAHLFTKPVATWPVQTMVHAAP